MERAAFRAALFFMIEVTLLNSRKVRKVVINADLIEVVEETPDTIITLNTERKMIVREKLDEIVSRVISYKRRIYNSDPLNIDWEELNN
jgi:flagellar protein FlbD